MVRRFFFRSAIAGIAVAGSLWAQSDQAATTFPAGLLNGIPKFQLAVQIHGDARGNFGPCG